MGRKYKYSAVTPDKWDEYYNMWIESGKSEKTFNRIIGEIEPYLDMCKKSFKVRPEYWDEYHCNLLVNIWRAFVEFNPERGARFSTWVYRLASQSAWGFIRNKCKDMDISIKQDELNESGCASLELGEDPETSIINHEDEESISNDLSAVLMGVLRGPIEREVYMRKYGIMGYVPQDIETMASELNLTTKTVEQIITRNNNSIGVFKRFLRDNDYNTKESMSNLEEILEQYRKFIKKPQKN